MTALVSPFPVRLQAALDYAARGWFVFPVHSVNKEKQCSCGQACGRAGKHPRTQAGFKDATREQDAIKTWWKEWPEANIGIACGKSRLVVVDVDPRNNGDEGLASLQKQHGALPGTLTSNTGGGGQHYFFSLPDGVDKCKSHDLSQGVELKSDGGYIIAPPSSHVIGTYAWDVGQPSEPVPAPFWLVDTPAKGIYRSSKKPPIDGVMGAAFIAAGMAGAQLGPDKIAVKCPWEDEHTGGKTYDGSTVVFSPMMGKALGWFHCSHAHCSGRKQTDVLQVLPESAVSKAKELVGSTAPAEVRAEMPREAWEQSLTYKPDGSPRPEAGNLRLYVENMKEWRSIIVYDSSKDLLYWRDVPPVLEGLIPPETGARVADQDWVYIAQWFSLRRGVTFKKQDVQDVIVATSQARAFSSLTRYLDGCEWDGLPRVDEWLIHYFGVKDDAYSRFVGRSWLVSLMARAYNPGCQVDHTLVLESREGTGKTTAFRTLGGDWYVGHLPRLDDKDARAGIQSAWIVELQELASFNGVEMQKIKAFLTETVDRYRPSYGRNFVERPRRCVFCGSTNEHDYIRDTTGARRFWPVRVQDVRTQELFKDRDQLFAEARTLYEAGVKWWPEKGTAIVGRLEAEQEARVLIDPWEQRIGHVIRTRDLPRFTTGEVFNWLEIEPQKQDALANKRITHVCRRLGWERRREMAPSGELAWVWVRGVE